MPLHQVCAMRAFALHPFARHCGPSCRSGSWSSTPGLTGLRLLSTPILQGVFLYWITSNTWSLAQASGTLQWLIWLPSDDDLGDILLRSVCCSSMLPVHSLLYYAGVDAVRYRCTMRDTAMLVYVNAQPASIPSCLSQFSGVQCSRSLLCEKPYGCPPSTACRRQLPQAYRYPANL